MNHFTFSAVLVFFASAVAGVFLVLKPNAAVRQFGIFWLCVSLWTFFVGFQEKFLSSMSGFTWGWWLHIGCIGAPLLFFHFALHVSGRRKSWAGRLKLAYAVAILFVLLNSFTRIFTAETIYRDFYAYPKPAILYPLYITYFQVVGITSTVLIFNLRNRIAGAGQQYLNLFLIVHILAYAGAMDNYLIMYDIRQFPLYPYGLYAVIAYVVLGTYAFLKFEPLISK